MIGIYKILVFVITTTFYIVDIICSLINVGFKTVNNSTIVSAHCYKTIKSACFKINHYSFPQFGSLTTHLNIFGCLQK